MTDNQKAQIIKLRAAGNGYGKIWGSMVEFITVGRDKEITVTFRDGSEILA